MKKLKQNRWVSFVAVALVYAITAVCGVALSVICAAPNVWYLAAGAVANTVLFFAVSIPMADGRQSRKDGFDRYKKETRMLLPIKR